jgi:hypothetical protein
MLQRAVAVFQLAGKGWQGDGGGDFGVVNCLPPLAIAIGGDDQTRPVSRLRKSFTCR